MGTVEFLTGERDAIVEAAESSLRGAHAEHYDAAGAAEVRRRLETLFDRMLEAVAARDLGPAVGHAERIAEERFTAGYGLSEVQTAFNVLEEATWTRIFAGLEPGEYAEALGLVSTVLGAAKDALARRYVSLATNAHVPALDLSALFAG